MVALTLGALVWVLVTPNIEDCKEIHWHWITYVFARTFIIGCTICKPAVARDRPTICSARRPLCGNPAQSNGN
jgi:hypothetical protein